MEQFAALTPLLSSVLATVLLLVITRIALKNALLTQDHSKDALIEQDSSLRPAEIAYLNTNGDIDHTLLVLGADLVQRALKSKLSGTDPQLAHYETRMFDLAKETVAGWATSKIEQHLPSNIQKDPIEYARRVSKIYKFIVYTARSWITEIVADPRQIRRYFRMSAIANLIADFSSAGYKAAFEDEFCRNLNGRGLLVTSQRRFSFAKIHFLFAVLGTLTLLTLSGLLLQPWYLGLTLSVVALISALVLRFVLFVLHSVPLYSEIASVLGHLERKSWRLNLLRSIINIFTALSYLLVLMGYLVLNAVVLAVLSLGFHQLELTLLVVYALLTASFLIPLQFLYDAWLLTIEQRPSKRSQLELVQIRRRLASSSPLGSFKEVLVTTEYVPTFSELLALYGIETLLILA